MQGVTAISADGSHVYFVAQGVLTTAERAQGQKRPQARTTSTCTSVTPKPAGTPRSSRPCRPRTAHEAGDRLGRQDRDANVTPDGRFLVFDSHGDLTPDDHPQRRCSQIFRYDAETGELVRISIGEDGFDDDGNAGTGDAAIVPAEPAD